MPWCIYLWCSQFCDGPTNKALLGISLDFVLLFKYSSLTFAANFSNIWWKIIAEKNSRGLQHQNQGKLMSTKLKTTKLLFNRPEEGLNEGRKNFLQFHILRWENTCFASKSQCFNIRTVSVGNGSENNFLRASVFILCWKWIQS